MFGKTPSTRGRPSAVVTSRRNRPTVRGMLTTTSFITGAVIIGVLGAGGTYALWNSSAPLPAATLKSGTATLAVSAPLSMATDPLYPGRTVYGTATVANTGDVPLVLSVSALAGPGTPDAFSQSLTVGVGVVDSAATCAAGTFTPTWTGTFAAATAGTLSSTATLGGSRIVCVSVSMSGSASAAALGKPAATFSLTLTGTQA